MFKRILIFIFLIALTACGGGDGDSSSGGGDSVIPPTQDLKGTYSLTAFRVVYSNGVTLTQNDINVSGSMEICEGTITQSIEIEGTPYETTAAYTVTYTNGTSEGFFSMTYDSETYDISFSISGNNITTYSGEYSAGGLTFEEWDTWTKISNDYCASGESEGPSPPDSLGSEETGIDVRIMNITHSSPAGDIGDAWLIDLYQSECDGENEAWGDDYANVRFEGIPLYDTEIENILFITSYRVTFDPLSPENPPIEEIRGNIQGSYTIIPNTQTGPYSFMVLDIDRKIGIQNVLAQGTYPSNFPLLYQMTLEMYGQDMYGRDFEAGPIIRMLEISPYDNC